MLSERIEQKIRDLPSKPGVYIMRDEHEHILYIGKAVSLKNRVRQYFGSPKNKTEKVMIMVSKIADFDYIITNNEIEALVLENNLIKKHKPPYNILLKDDKNYPFIRISQKEKFPRIEVVRKLKKDGAKYYGPYMQGITSRDILELIYSAFALRSCALNMSKVPKSHRPCLNYHINRCLAPCSGNVTAEQYNAELDEAIKFLSGNDKSIAKILTEKMAKASVDEDYELAIFYRDKLKVLEKLVRKQVTVLPIDYDMDLFAIASDGINTVVAILFVRGGKLIGGDKLIISDAALSLNTSLTSYIFNYYDSAPNTPELILTNIELDGSVELAEYYSKKVGSKVNIITPSQGVRRQLIDMAESNARDYLGKCVSEAERKENMTIGSLNQLKDKLNLEKIPYRMECFDISHISGTDMVASMAVFVNGEASKQMYRKFKIKTVEGNNDYECMKEVLMRRLKEFRLGEDLSFACAPDLIVIDGGLGQLKYAEEAMTESGIRFEMIALAEREDDVYKLDRTKVVIDKRSQAIMILQRLRDEAHRFAVTFHQQQRAKRLVDSQLAQIEGVGEARIKALHAYFKSINKIKAATVEELRQVPMISEITARAIYEFYHED